ncbi:hypothetical protein BC936DRAFT_141191 [Jimgerdemannia flammicorona]|uniref:Uncharacterized protein n=1 Tax=Jimgerdemannia flammicorona TaxID=994334 RepID=A0A433A2Q2_9FUNG|nr:hypothetical protein BC936DRAFT_141191 [Jimgerdemannia flammicorona]
MAPMENPHIKVTLATLSTYRRWFLLDLTYPLPKLYFAAIQASDTSQVRSLIATDQTLTTVKTKGDYRYEGSIELDAYKFLGAYVGQMTGLQAAILWGRDTVAKDIIDATFREVSHPWKRPPLHHIHPSLFAHLSTQSSPQNGNTALHLAVLVGAAEIVKILLDRGADVTIKNGKGFTPVDVSDNPEIMALLAAAKAD